MAVQHPRTGIRDNFNDQEAVENNQNESVFTPWDGKFCNTLPYVAQMPKSLWLKSDEGITEYRKM